MDELLDGDLVGAATAIRRGAVSARALTEAALDRIGRREPGLNAFLHLEADAAMAAARRADEAFARGRSLGPLHGIPIARKDLFDRAGQRNTSGSAILRDHVARATATCLARLDAAGAVDLGGLNMSEFAYHMHGANSLSGPPRNPWDLRRTAGGSSGGSGAALAARLVFGALGSDTGGSIRSPAALNGIVGLVPTRGRVSRHGMAYGCPSLDIAGPMARTVRDCARLLGVVAGHDPADLVSAAVPVPDYEEGIDAPVRGLIVARPDDAFLADLAPDIRAAYDRALATYRELGVASEIVALGNWDALNAAAVIVQFVEVAAAHRARLAVHWDDYLAEIRDRMAAGFAHDPEDRLKALAIRARATSDFVSRALRRADALLLPSSIMTAPRLADIAPGNTIPALATAADLGRYLRVVNYLGLPALALPAGFSADGLPLGIQLVGRPFDEATLFRLGHAFQQATGHHRRAPALD
jgi:aspartyl-tRNA(Asn)/glutamyl-tRNA(Gln) amidotransferase subunit A